MEQQILEAVVLVEEKLLWEVWVLEQCCLLLLVEVLEGREEREVLLLVVVEEELELHFVGCLIEFLILQEVVAAEVLYPYWQNHSRPGQLLVALVYSPQ